MVPSSISLSKRRRGIAMAFAASVIVRASRIIFAYPKFLFRSAQKAL